MLLGASHFLASPVLVGVGRLEHPATSSVSKYLQKDFLPRNPHLAGRRGFASSVKFIWPQIPFPGERLLLSGGLGRKFHAYCAAAQSAVPAVSFLALQVPDFPNCSSECEGAKHFVISGFCLVSLY